MSELHGLTLVTVGNATRSFDRLLSAVGRLAQALPQPVVVQRGHTPFSAIGADVRDFIRYEEFLQLMEKAALVISHAGVGTIIHAVRTGHRPVVMPRLARFGEHVDDHQVELAQALGRAGKVCPVFQADELPRAIQDALDATRVTRAAPPTRIVGLVAQCIELVGRTNSGAPAEHR